MPFLRAALLKNKVKPQKQQEKEFIFENPVAVDDVEEPQELINIAGLHNIIDKRSNIEPQQEQEQEEIKKIEEEKAQEIFSQPEQNSEIEQDFILEEEEIKTNSEEPEILEYVEVEPEEITLEEEEIKTDFEEPQEQEIKEDFSTQSEIKNIEEEQAQKIENQEEIFSQPEQISEIEPDFILEENEIKTTSEEPEILEDVEVEPEEITLEEEEIKTDFEEPQEQEIKEDFSTQSEIKNIEEEQTQESENQEENSETEQEIKLEPAILEAISEKPKEPEKEPEEFKLKYDVTSGERYVDKVSMKTEFDKMLDELANISKDLLAWQTEKFAKEYTGKFQGDFDRAESDAKKYEAFLGGYITNAAMALYDNGYRDAAIKQLEQAQNILIARKKLEDETQAIKERVEEEEALVDLSDILGMFGDG